MPLRGYVSFIAAVVLAVVVARVGWAGTDQPDPSVCRNGGDGYFYVAFGSDVFRWKPKTFVISRRVPEGSDRDPLLGPIDPTQPPGCHDNPLRLLSGGPVVGATGLILAPDSNDAGRPFVTLGLVPPDFSVQSLREENFRAVCEGEAGTGAHKMERVDPPGLKKCSIQSLVDPDRWPASYEADPEKYTTPFGESFIVPCLLVGTHDCWAGYKIDQTLQLGYMFNLKDLPIDYVIDFDRSLRATIEEHRVKDYVWPPG